MSHPAARRVAAALIFVLCPALALPAGDAIVARVSGQEIPYSVVDERIKDKLAELQRHYDAQERRLTLNAARERAQETEAALTAVVDERVLALEAAATHLSPLALRQAHTAAPVSEAAERAFYAAQPSLAARPFDGVRAQIHEYLQEDADASASQDYLQTLRRKYHADIVWEPLREQVGTSGPQRGPVGAVVTIVEFSDFQCPYCARLEPVLRQLQQEYPSQVRLVFRHLPLRAIHANAAKAAEASVCADRQGHFWEMHDSLYASQGKLGTADLKERAVRLGLDQARFNQCLDAGEAVPTVNADELEATDLGLPSTPGSFVNGRFVDGAEPLYRWEALVADELARRRRATPN